MINRADVERAIAEIFAKDGVGAIFQAVQLSKMLGSADAETASQILTLLPTINGIAAHTLGAGNRVEGSWTITSAYRR